MQSRGAGTRKLHSGRDPTSCELDRQVLEYTEKVKDGHGHSHNCLGIATLKDKQLQQVARDYAARLGVHGFKASGSWLRGWKGRCRQGGEGGKKRRTKSTVLAAKHSPSLHTASSNLSTLTEQEKRGVVYCPRNCAVANPSRNGEIASDKQPVASSYPHGEQEASSTSASVMSIAHSYQEELRNGAPGQNYSNSSQVAHNHVATPPPECATPPCLQVHMEELLEGVVLLGSHDQEEKLDLMALEEEVGVAVGEVPHHQLHQDVLALPGLVPNDAHHSCHAPPSLLEGEDSVMSLFNHRSFTDHFPFLPPSLINSNWCPPYDPRYPNGTMEHLMQATPPADLTLPGGGPCQPKAKSKGRPTVDVGMSRYHTRSKVQAQTLTSANVATTALYSLNSVSGWLTTHTPSPSPSPLDTLHSPTCQPAGGGVALLSPSSDGAVGSPPGGGLLANRLFQPVFPDEPEIVFHEIQLGPLHTTPGHGP